MSTNPAKPEGRRRASWTTVAKHEMWSQLTDRAFWIGTITTLLLIGASFFIAGLVSAGDGSPAKVAVATDDAAAVVALSNQLGTRAEAVRVSAEQLTPAVQDGEADVALAFSPDTGWQLAVTDMTSVPDLSPAVRVFQIEQNSAAAGVDPAAVLQHTDVSVVPLNGDESTAVGVVVGTVAFSILFMLSAVTYGMQIAQSVVTEKESRIVEILAAVVPVRQLLIGKVIGNSVMALGQVVLIVAVALIGLSRTQFAPMLSTLAPVSGWFVLFFLVGFATLACLWAGAGAMATRTQDLSQTTTPLTMVIMAVYFAGFFAKGSAGTILSYVPIASSVVMPGRLLSGDATWLDAVGALLVAVVFMALAIWIGERIYRRGLLQTTTVLKLKDAFTRAD